MGEIEFSKCDICKQDAQVLRKYYHYDVKCDCCNSKDSPHFEIVKYCVKCEPKPPRTISVMMCALEDQNVT